MVEIYDIEVFPNFFSYTGLCIDTKQISVFVLHESNFQYDELGKQLNKLKGQIGFNNVNYDYPILHWMKLNSITEYNSLNDYLYAIYNESQRLINEKYSAIKEKDVQIPQLDLFRLNHFDNKAKMTSLKALEIKMQLPNVQDLPLPFDKPIKESDISNILAYNLNDVEATYQFYLKNLNKIKLRKKLSKKYNLNMINYPDPKIGESILLVECAKPLNTSIWELKKLRTFRKNIILKDIILPYIKFETKEFQNLLKYMNNQIVVNTKGDINYSVILINKFKFDYGTGGIHGSIKSGIYTPNNDEIILDLDVISFYPLLAVTNEFYPAHLGKIFCDIMYSIFEERKLYPKDTHYDENYGCKISMNGAYG